jgi:hypothetical protein
VLAGGVGGLQWNCAQGKGRCDVYDGSATLALHLKQRTSATKDLPEKIDLDDALELCWLRMFDGCVLAYRGVINPGVDPAKAADGLLGQALDLCRVPDVCLHR